MAKKRSFPLQSSSADSDSSGAYSTSFSRSGFSDRSAESESGMLSDSTSSEAGSMVAALEVTSPISAGRAPCAAASAVAPSLSSAAAPFMPDWLKKVMEGSSFDRASDSEAGPGEYVMGEVSSHVKANIIAIHEGRSPLRELPVQDFVSPPPIKKASGAQPLFSPYAAASPSTPIRSSGAKASEDSPSDEKAPTMLRDEENDGENIVHMGGSIFNLSHLGSSNTAPDTDPMGQPSGDTALHGLAPEY